MAGIAEDEIVEHTLAQIPECYLFELPPRIRAQGWLAADMTKQMWTGRMRVVQRGMEAAIMLVDRRDGKLFAMSKVQDGAVERVPDSSRYFVLKIQNAQGRHAFVGLAFDDRNQAFDFNVALQEFKKDVERNKMLEKGDAGGGGGQGGTEDGDESHEIPHKTKDLSLKEGQTIRISIGGTCGKTSSRTRKSAGGGGSGGLALAPPPGDTSRRKGGGGGIGLLAPPPGDTRRARGIAKPAPTMVSSGGNSAPQPNVSHHSSIPPAAKQEADDDPLGLGLGSTAPPPQQQQQPVLGLSDMTGLGATLPSSGSMGSATSVSSGQRKNGGYTHDPFSQPQAFPQSGSGYGQGGFPGGVQSTGASGGTTHKAAGADDPFGGLF